MDQDELQAKEEMLATPAFVLGVSFAGLSKFLPAFVTRSVDDAKRLAVALNRREGDEGLWTIKEVPSDLYSPLRRSLPMQQSFESDVAKNQALHIIGISVSMPLSAFWPGHYGCNTSTVTGVFQAGCMDLLECS